MDGCIGPLVALLHEFAKETGDSVAPIFPALKKRREIRIKVTGLLPRFARRQMHQQLTNC